MNIANNLQIGQVSFYISSLPSQSLIMITLQEICLGLTGSDCQQVYVIQPGDTCEDIETTLSVDAATLKANNPQIEDDCSNLYYGEVSYLTCSAFNHLNGHHRSSVPLVISWLSM